LKAADEIGRPRKAEILKRAGGQTGLEALVADANQMPIQIAA